MKRRNTVHNAQSNVRRNSWAAEKEGSSSGWKKQKEKAAWNGRGNMGGIKDMADMENMTDMAMEDMLTMESMTDTAMEGMAVMGDMTMAER